MKRPAFRPIRTPFEVAWNLADGSIESHLISPVQVPGWDDWSEVSETIHGISRGELIEFGKQPVWVATRIQDTLGGSTLYSDAPRFDGFWLERLFEAAGSGSPAVQIADAGSLILQAIIERKAPAASGFTMLYFQQTARKRNPKMHRAAWDVAYLIDLWKLGAGIIE